MAKKLIELYCAFCKMLTPHDHTGVFHYCTKCGHKHVN